MPKYTLHDVDPDVYVRANEKARAAGWNMGDLLKQLLADYANGKTEPTAPPPRPRPAGEAPRRTE
jgi:hypothetical protein